MRSHLHFKTKHTHTHEHSAMKHLVLIRKLNTQKTHTKSTEYLHASRTLSYKSEGRGMNVEFIRLTFIFMLDVKHQAWAETWQHKHTAQTFSLTLLGFFHRAFFNLQTLKLCKIVQYMQFLHSKKFPRADGVNVRRVRPMTDSRLNWLTGGL